MLEPKWISFTEAFTNAMKGRKDGQVGIKDLTKILEACGIEETPQKLVKDGWLAPHVKPGRKRTGCYGPGEKMLAAKEPVPPTDSIELMKWLIARKPMLLAQRDSIRSRFRAELAPVSKELGEISAVEATLERLKAAFPARK